MKVDPSQRSRPIGVFDSGLGGLTVAAELAELLPGEDIVYLGDSARVPYGIKSLETVRRFAREDAKFLLGMDPKLLVVACNTASAAAIDTLRDLSGVSVVDVIAPGSAEAITCGEGPVGAVATEATIRSGAYQATLESLAPGREVHLAACPLLVPIVEEGRAEDDPIVTHVLCDYLRDMLRVRPTSLILGCTHYPLLSRAIGKLMGPDTTLISSGAAAARDVARVLEACDAKNPQDAPGQLDCYTTDNPERFAKLGERFGRRKLTSVHYVGTDELELNFS
ncbi:MAG: glutamate racemase [Phycisphaerales bacterium]|nr:glutamate racemase [Phycisphaerales bacterium]